MGFTVLHSAEPRALSIYCETVGDVIYENFCVPDTCLLNFDVETFRYRSLGRRKLWLADNIKMCRMEVGFSVDG
jgi:hypothetical protein